jgi:hypothetical protein
MPFEDLFYALYIYMLYVIIILYSSVSQQLGRDPLLGRRHLLLGRQNLCFSTIIVKYGSPNCVIFCFVGRQLPNVENLCYIA